MKVSELIHKLYNFNQDAEVTTPYFETIELGYICIDSEGNPIDSRETPLVFIQGCDYVQEEDC